MHKLVIFDLDGVLIDSRNIHYVALNAALENNGYIPIDPQAHVARYDGLSTTAKLKMLTQEQGLPVSSYDKIWQDKQKYTEQYYDELIKPNAQLQHLFAALRERGAKIAVASNSIRRTLQQALINTGLLKYVDYFCSNEDVKKSKPHPEMYWQCMSACGATAKTTLIVEDSHIGRQGAINSGATLLAVEDVWDVSYDKVMGAFMDLTDDSVRVPWRDKKLNVLIPMAGAGSRFEAAGYTFPKPLIEVNGKPMIEVVCDSLNVEANYIFIVQKSHYEKYNLQYLLQLIKPGCKVVQVDQLTEGAACTTLLAAEYIDNDQPLLIANSDQYIEWDSNNCMYAFSAEGVDGGILTFESIHPKWSYAKLDDAGFVCEVAEKKVISNLATVGVYYWKRGSDYCRYAREMIERDIRVNNEFYVAPVFNQAIADGKKIRVKNIEKMWGLGTPEDLNYFLEHSK